MVRLLPVFDHFTHECLDIVAEQSLRADDVAEVVVCVIVQRGTPEAIRVMWVAVKRPRPMPLRPEARTLVVNRGGQPLSRDTYNSACAGLQSYG